MEGNIKLFPNSVPIFHFSISLLSVVREQRIIHDAFYWREVLRK